MTVFEHIPLVINPNFKKIPVTAFPRNDEGAHLFNQVYQEVLKRNLRKIVRTKSGGISYELKNFSGACWDIKNASTWTEMTVIVREGMFRFQFRTKNKKNEFKIYGSTAFRVLADRLHRDGVDLTNYAIENGAAVKETIQKLPINIDQTSDADLIFDHVYHIDFHSSFPAGLANTYPEFRKTLQKIYDERHDREKSMVNKAILNYSIGFMQSLSCCNARWAQLSKAAIEDNNRRVYALSDEVRKNYKILLFNTDGFWYCDRRGELGPYHGPGEGLNMGEWQNDHLDCRFRMRSPRCYEYIENDQYFPIVSGETNLDKLKPRTEWEWGDIYRKEAFVQEYSFIEGKGVCRYGEDEPL